MGGLTFLDYVKELPKGKREAKGATKGGYATAAAPKKPAAAPAAAAAATPNGAAAVESTARALPGVEETKGGGGGSEADAIGDKIAAKVRAVTNASNAGTINFGFVLFAQGHLQAYLTFELQRCQNADAVYVGEVCFPGFRLGSFGCIFFVFAHTASGGRRRRSLNDGGRAKASPHRKRRSSEILTRR